MQCDSASMPVAADRRGGSVAVSSGSSSARRGTRWSELMPTEGVLASGCSPAEGEASLPVPAVVGMATSGAAGPIRAPGTPA